MRIHRVPVPFPPDITSGSFLSSPLVMNHSGILETGSGPTVFLQGCAQASNVYISNRIIPGKCYKIVVNGFLHQWGNGWFNDPYNGLGSSSIWYTSQIIGLVKNALVRQNNCSAGTQSTGPCGLGFDYLGNLYDLSGLGIIGYVDHTPGPSVGVWQIKHVVGYSNTYINTSSWNIIAPFSFTLYTQATNAGIIQLSLFSSLQFDTVFINGSGGLYRYGNNTISTETYGTFTAYKLN